jgi:hypothetical protein
VLPAKAGSYVLKPEATPEAGSYVLKPEVTPEAGSYALKPEAAQVSRLPPL